MTDTTNDNNPRLLDQTLAANNLARLFEVADDVFSDFPARVRRANMRADTAALASGNHNQRDDAQED
jgi:hypothetical protein